MAVSRKPVEKETPRDGAERGRGVAYLAAVGRNLDGTPNVPGEFRLLLHEGASDDDKRAAWGHPDGELPDEGLIVYVPNPSGTTSDQRVEAKDEA